VRIYATVRSTLRPPGRRPRPSRTGKLGRPSDARSGGLRDPHHGPGDNDQAILLADRRTSQQQRVTLPNGLWVPESLVVRVGLRVHQDSRLVAMIAMPAHGANPDSAP
jgi:hypothetical protein